MKIHVSFIMSTSCQQDLKIKAKGVERFLIKQIDIIEDVKHVFLYTSGHLDLMSRSLDQILYLYMFSKFKAMPPLKF